MSTLLNHQQFQSLAQDLYKHLSSGETLALSLHAEDTTFLRFNQSLVRQATHVTQMSVALTLQWEQREIEQTVFLGLKPEHNLEVLLAALKNMRQDIKALPIDPYFVPHAHYPASNQVTRGELPKTEEFELLCDGVLKNVDLAGIYCGGPLIKAVANSLKLDHWFETDSFYFDYSIFNGEKAVKGGYAGTHWKRAELEQKLSESKTSLEWLKLPVVDVAPGAHRTYLAPAAAGEFIGMLGWGGVSFGQYKRGQCSLGKLFDGEEKLNEKFTLEENFERGLAPSFNDLGEKAPSRLVLVEQGRGVNLLTSARSAAEYKGEANGAIDQESFRSAVIAPGKLPASEVLEKLGTGLYLSNLHYLNYSDMTGGRVTGMTRYACFWVENGKIKGPIKDLRFDESIYKALGSELEDLTVERELFPSTSTYFSREFGALEAPGIMLKSMTFTL
jgi:predicted Zn-dependent protease